METCSQHSGIVADQHNLAKSIDGLERAVSTLNKRLEALSQRPTWIVTTVIAFLLSTSTSMFTFLLYAHFIK